MRISAYLKSHALHLFVTVLTLAVVYGALRVGGCSNDLAALAVGIIAVCTIAIVWFDYSRESKFLHQLSLCTDENVQALWALEMVDAPDYPEAVVAYEALKAVSAAANEEAAVTRRQVSEYREYIELWVHEAKSPLAAAQLAASNLELTQDSKEHTAERMRVLRQELDQVDSYVDQALFYARSETLDRDYLIREHNLRDIVNAALKANAAVLIDAHVSPKLEQLDYKVFTDEKWTIFILGQIIQNSVKYRREANASITFDARLADEGQARERVELTVRDNGCGVEASELERVSDKGFTGTNGRTFKRATGIGLYLVKRLCDKMSVRVAARSTPGEGFAVVLGFAANRLHYIESDS